MKSGNTRTIGTPPPDAVLGMEAAGWLLRLGDPELDPDEPYRDLEARNAAFLAWVATSPSHLRVFIETLETHRRLPMIDPEQLMDVERLLAGRPAEVVRLYGQAVTNPSRTARPPRRRRLAAVAGAVAAVVGIVAGLYWFTWSAPVYTTAVGEQRSAKLRDGSFVYLNTDSRVEIEFSEHARDIRLVRGEALFVVERDSSRPFTVHAGSTAVQAIGTRFNVRRREEGADVAVVEGVVQVATDRHMDAGTPLSSSAQMRLTAGQGARVTGNRIAQTAGAADPLAWRQRRLVFQDARLADVAAEFNRYNHTRIHVRGEAARNILLSGIFDADRPQVLMLYAARNDALAVEPDGSDWVIRAR